MIQGFVDNYISTYRGLAMANFKRGLCSKTLPVVRDFFCNTDVGRKIKGMRDLDICIRDNYINIYKEGCSLLKFSPNESNREYEIHHNYISEPVKGKKYVFLKLENGDLVRSENPRPLDGVRVLWLCQKGS
jgi:hypothetical protein